MYRLSARATPRSFSLLRTFSLGSLAVIAVLAAAAATLMSRFVTDRMLWRDATLTAEFMQSVIVTPAVVATLGGDAAQVPRNLFVQQMNEIGAMPDVIRANVYDDAGRIAWSSDKRLVGQAPGANDELDEAMRGHLVMHRGRTDGSEHEKPEHRFLARSVGEFVETYVPIRDPAGKVVGAVELYRIPRALFETLRTGTVMIWAAAIGGALVLFGVLFWIVRAGDRTLHWQHQKLLETGRLAAVGEMAASVAHGIRNPLASIRSSAELALDADPRDLSRSAHDIIASVDRAERWVSDLLRCAVPAPGVSGTPGTAIAGSADPSLAVTTAFEQYESEFRKRGVEARLDVERGLPFVAGSTDALAQLIAGLLANSVEAGKPGVQILLAARRLGQDVLISVEDTGAGIPREDLQRVFEPYFTSKARGLGLGLPLARATIERIGGRIAIDSAPARGTIVRIALPAAPPVTAAAIVGERTP